MSEVRKRAGGLDALARAVGVRKQTVWEWSRVPPKHVLRVEELTGIPASELRPDIYPPCRFGNR